MNNSIREIATRAAGRWMIGLASLLPLMAGAAAPTASISSIQAVAQTNYNGSAVMATFTGSLDDYNVALEVDSASYAGTVSGSAVSFFVPGNVAAASNIYASKIVATEKADSSKRYEIGARYLYQGAIVAGTPAAWFAESTAQSGGSWSPEPAVADNKFVFDDEADEWADGWKRFTPAVPQQGHAATLVMDVAFDCAMDNCVDDVSGVQASVRLVTVDEDRYRFAYFDGGAWKTNDVYEAFLNTNYTVRMEFSYHTSPATVSYYVKTGTVETLLKANAAAGGNKIAIESLSFNGCGKLAQMEGSNVVDSVDASLVKDADEAHYANIDEATEAGKTELTLLWNTAWTPDAAVDRTWTIHDGGKNLYVNDVPGICVTKEDGTYTVIANYWEVMNVYDAVETKFTFLTEALAASDPTVTNLFLLRDVTSDMALNKSLVLNFNGKALVADSVDLGAHDLTLAGDATAVETFNALTGTGVLTNNAAAALLVKNVDDFAGSIGVAAEAGGVTIGAEVAADNAGRITLAAGATAAIASGKSWTAANGIAVNGSLGGAGTLASATAFGNAATLTSGALTALAEPTFGNALNVTIQDAATGTDVMTVPEMPNPTTAVTVSGTSGYSLIYKSGKLQLYKQAPAVFTVAGVAATAQTNFNGSAVVVTYTGYSPGSCENVTAKLEVNGQTYVWQGTLEADGGTMTFNVASNVVTAGQLDTAVITVAGTDVSSGDPVTAYDGAKYLYQGTATNLATNAWFEVTAVRLAEDGVWSPSPTVEDGKILFPEDDDSSGLVDYSFTPANGQQGQVVVVEADMMFEATLDSVPFDNRSMQGALRVVAVGDVSRFAALVGGVWVTNTAELVNLAETYTIRTTFDYRDCPSTVKYELKKGDAYVVIADGVSRTDKATLAATSFAGEGALVRMTGKDCVSLLDASLVAGSNGKHYATPVDALNAGVTNLTLLWNTAWQPTTGAGAFTISKGGYNWYYTPEEGLLVRENPDGSCSVITDYWEVMNLLGGEGTDYMFLTNVLKLAETDASLTNLYLLRDVALPAGVAVYRDTLFNGESNILSGAGLTVQDGKTFTVVGGCIGILKEGCAGNIAFTGGRFNEATTNSWKSLLAGDTNTFAELAVPVRPGYEWQLMKTEDAPKSGQELLPVTDANGESVSIVLNTDWVNLTVPGKTPAEQSAELSVIQNNELTRLDNEILGLANQAGNIPVIAPVQSSTADKVTFSLDNVSIAEDSGAKVKYRVFKSSKPGGKDGGSSALTDPDKDVQMDLPSSGVQYYIIEVDTGAVK